MDTIPNFKSEKDFPFDIDKYVNSIRNEYEKYYNKYLKDFKDSLSREDKDFTIIVYRKMSSNSKIKVPFLQEKAALNFVWSLKYKQYLCEYTTHSKRHGNDPDYYENWSQITINM